MEDMGDEDSRTLKRNNTWAVALTAVGCGLLIGAYLLAEGLGETATGTDTVASIFCIRLERGVLASALVFGVPV